MRKFTGKVKMYNAYCIRCGWKGISLKLLKEGEIPLQCTVCHNRGTVRKNK
jgi:hypothetical protein